MTKRPTAHNPQTGEVIEDQPDVITLASETLAGDLRDFILDRLKHDHNPIPWHMRPEGDQRDMIFAVESATRTWVHRACVLIAANGQKVIRGSLAKFAAKDGIETQIKVAASDPLRHALMDRVGQTVLIVLTDADEHLGERAAVPINKDQKDLLERDDTN